MDINMDVHVHVHDMENIKIFALVFLKWVGRCMMKTIFIFVKNLKERIRFEYDRCHSEIDRAIEDILYSRRREYILYTIGPGYLSNSAIKL